MIAGIARDLSVGIDAEVTGASTSRLRPLESGPSPNELLLRLANDGTVITAPRTGYLQFVAYDTVVGLAMDARAVIRLLYRPGHFVVEGLPMAEVWPADAASAVSRSLDRAHFTGPHRTLTQDLAFGIDQLVEIALRALSPAVNDTFTALTCIDWLSDTLCKIAVRWNPRVVHRDHHGHVRVIAADVPFSRFVERAFDKIRQAGEGMPAVMIRQLEALIRVMQHAADADQRAVLLEQADMIVRSSERSVPEPCDLADVRRRYEMLTSLSSSAG